MFHAGLLVLRRQNCGDKAEARRASLMHESMDGVNVFKGWPAGGPSA
jgi:hypothetical protein